MKTAKQKTGSDGEALAEKYLLQLGYQIRERNYRLGYLEADLICEFKNELIFVEVKSRFSIEYGFPEMAVSGSKKINLARLANDYIEIVRWEGEVRFDIVSISYSGGVQIDHFKDAFYPGLF